MNDTRKRLPQYRLRSLLVGMTWLAMLIAICVGHQRAASRQRAVIEQLRTAGVLPLTITQGQPTPAQAVDERH